MRRKIPSFQALSCFESAARHESYTRAADELALTQGAVSRQISSLEAFLGTPLFRRTRHGVALTPAGLAYLRQVSTRLDGLERDTLDAMGNRAEGGALQIAAVPTFATRWLLPRLADFSRRHPDITVHLETRTRPFLFADTPFDGALYAGTPAQIGTWPGTQTTLLMDESVVPVASPALLAGRIDWTPADLAGLPLLQQSTRPEAWRQWFDAQGVTAPGSMQGPRYELFSMAAMAASHGLGVALIPTLLIEPELRQGELVVVCPTPLQGRRAYYFVTPDASVGRQAVQAFRDWLLGQSAPSLSLSAASQANG